MAPVETLKSNDDTSTIWSPIPTPPESITDVVHSFSSLDCAHHGSAVTTPVPGHVFTIRSAEDGRILMLMDGKPTLAHSDDRRGSALWKCVERQGWLGFQNLVSGNHLGYNLRNRLICQARYHGGKEFFSLRPMVDGGYWLMADCWGALCSILILKDGDQETFVKDSEQTGNGIIWQFTREEI